MTPEEKMSKALLAEVKRLEAERDSWRATADNLPDVLAVAWSAKLKEAEETAAKTGLDALGRRYEERIRGLEALGQRLYEELDEMRTQFLSDGPFVGWRERQKDAVDEALAAYEKAQQGEKPSDE